MRFLDGSILAKFVKDRQTEAIAKLVRDGGSKPQLAIITTAKNPVTDIYIKLKGEYAKEIGAVATVHVCEQAQIMKLMGELEEDLETTGIIIQLPLSNPSETEAICQLIPPSKDIDGLNPNSGRDSATAMAIDWLLAGYGIELRDKKLVIIGRGKLVGQPLYKLWLDAGLNVTSMDEDSLSFESVKAADIVVTATGCPGLLKANHLAEGAVVVDAGTASVNGRLAGDIDTKIYELRNDLIITPSKGGVGPMTIAVLFERLIAAATPRST